MCDKKFDREYSVTWIREKKFLDACGIQYKFVKIIDGITIFKYEKTSYLFECLTLFYRQFQHNIEVKNNGF